MSIGFAGVLIFAAVMTVAGLIVSWKVDRSSGGLFVFGGLVALCCAGAMGLKTYVVPIFNSPYDVIESKPASFDENYVVEIAKDASDGQMLKVIRNRKTGNVVSVIPMKQPVKKEAPATPRPAPTSIIPVVPIGE